MQDIVLILITESTEKVSLDSNIRYSSIHHIHGYWYFPLLLLLFTVYTIIATVTVLLLLLSPQRPSILGNMDIDWLNWIK